MVRYFQLTPEILVEYVYTNDPKLNNSNEKDIYNDVSTMLLKSDAFGSKYLVFNEDTEKPDSFSNFVLPLNNTDTKFVIAKKKYQNFFSKNNVSNTYTLNGVSGYAYDDTNYDQNIKKNAKSCTVKYDRCIIHFTSRNFFENYNALIFQAYVYMRNKTKLYFTSFLLKKTSNLVLKPEHMLYNEKLYTTQIEFDIPSIFDIFKEYNKEYKNRHPFVKALTDQNIELLKNTPIIISVCGVNGSVLGVDNYERLKTLKLNSVSIPQTNNKFDEIQLKIYEADDGDYYYIDPEMGDSYPTFVGYIESMGEDIRSYIIMHDICLRESWVDNNNTLSKITHTEQHIINIDENDEDEEISARFDAKIKYRPICTQSGNGYVATIIDTLKIINTIDNTSFEVTGSLDIQNPHKYGKKLKQLNIQNDSRPIINVYNKKISDGSGGVNLIYKNSISLGRGGGSGGSGGGSGGGFVIENKTQNITSFIECTNIGVNIIELSPSEIN